MTITTESYHLLETKHLESSIAQILQPIYHRNSRPTPATILHCDHSANRTEPLTPGFLRCGSGIYRVFPLITEPHRIVGQFNANSPLCRRNDPVFLRTIIVTRKTFLALSVQTVSRLLERIHRAFGLRTPMNAFILVLTPYATKYHTVSTRNVFV